MQDNKNRVTVEIMGQQYTMLGQGSEEYLHSIALYVDKKMKELSKKGCTMNNTMLAVLTALNIADEFFGLKQDLEIAQKQAAKPGKELEDARYRLRKAGEEAARLKAEIENLKQQLANSQEEASNIYSEWLKAQKESKEAMDNIERIEEQKIDLELQIEAMKGYNKTSG
ncbi:MAG: cell division protein ZapA [Clostridiales bacterium]|jgi:cell division protein ZapA|nr:cell division protein ZapA [Clostridiales bacterium]